MRAPTPPASERLILVSEANRAIGTAEKLRVHREGRLHRAFSVFLVDDRGRLLLQQRHPAKYHSGGLWANSCCGHPRPGEDTRAAAQRRVREELGVTVRLRAGFKARYRTDLGNGLIENEVVYVYFGALPEEVNPAPREISALRRWTLREMRVDLRRKPATYVYWLRYYLEHHINEVKAGIARVVA